MVDKLMRTYPHARVFCGTLMQRRYSDAYSPSSRLYPIEQYNEQIRKIANTLGADIIDFTSCGIKYCSDEGTYTVEGLHPTADGAVLMKNKAKAELIAKY